MKAEILFNKQPVVFNVNVELNNSISIALQPTAIIQIDIVTSIAGSSINENDIQEIFDRMNPQPIIEFATEDITQYQIAGAKLNKVLAFADGRLLTNVQISNDTIIFNETIFQYQQLFIQYTLTL